MAITKYSFNKAALLDQLTAEVEGSNIATSLEYMNGAYPSTTEIFFSDALSSGDETTLNTIVDSHTPQQEDDMVEVILHKGKDYRLKRKGYTFNALADQTTNYNFTMPFDGHIQGGHFYAGNLKTGDMMEFILLPDVPGMEYKYIESLYVTQGEKYDIVEEFGMTDLIPAGTPLRVSYTNTDDNNNKTVNFQLTYRIPT